MNPEHILSDEELEKVSGGKEATAILQLSIPGFKFTYYDNGTSITTTPERSMIQTRGGSAHRV
ncbi:hypothetical protein [Bradyrhizobium sp. DOA9]|uniref:hypothetical protein n=1 Tax=Bradyrhizobium sp. DOA9 TaxID=1126627 RepID=UPI00046816CE|nr:hypothetical protein [Bradyrhizobium sp. DOA9]GAJ35419.1 hypothetical protein BDOA9_0146250 [Bradyrhizobium sp. DOA9]